MTGECRIRSVPQDDFPKRAAAEDCGEWQDGRFTPEQHERRELVRQFAVAIASGLKEPKLCYPADIWADARRYAEAENWR